MSSDLFVPIVSFIAGMFFGLLLAVCLVVLVERTKKPKGGGNGAA